MKEYNSLKKQSPTNERTLKKEATNPAKEVLVNSQKKKKLVIDAQRETLNLPRDENAADALLRHLFEPKYKFTVNLGRVEWRDYKGSY